MSWILTHQCRFQSRTHQQYCVNISKQSDTSVQIKQLTGSEHPFTTSEANGDDIFMPVRQQTGYLRVLDNSGGTLIDELLPENNTQKMVTLVNLTTGKTEWIGFLAAEVFTQPWGNELTELEFPLKSALACLADVTMQTGVTGTNRLAMLVYNAFTSIFGEGEVPFTQLVFLDDLYYPCDQLLICANFEKFFSKETIKNDSTETVVKVGVTYMEAMKSMCSIFGITLRQQGTSLVFGRYDNGGDFAVNIYTMEWGILQYIYNRTEAFPEVQPEGRIITKELLPIADFRGKENKLTYIQGGKAAIVSLRVDNSKETNIIELPKSDITDAEIRGASVVTNGEYQADYKRREGEFPFTMMLQDIIFAATGSISYLNFQYIARGNSNTETFANREVIVQLTSGTNVNIARTHTLQETAYDPMAVLCRSIFGNYGTYYSYSRMSVITGAVPGKWSKFNGLLEDCLLVVQDVNTSYDTPTTVAPLYKIKTEENVQIQDCYININFDVPVTIWSIVSGIVRMREEWNPDNISYVLKNNGVNYVLNGSSLVSGLAYSMVCKLYIEANDGHTYYWDENNATWVADTVKVFYMGIDGTGIMSNYHETMSIENTGGYLAKVEGTKVGKVNFEILNTVTISGSDRMKIKDPDPDINNEVEVFAYPFQRILTGLSVDLVYSRNITDIAGSENIYRKTIMEAGFSEDKQIDLDLGTYNNNTSSPALLRTWDDGGYVELVSYTNGSGEKVLERPEMHLLNRMVEYYKTMRRTMEAKIATGIDIFRNRFAYNGRKYMAIDKKHDWEREEQEVKFIEVT